MNWGDGNSITQLVSRFNKFNSDECLARKLYFHIKRKHCYLRILLSAALLFFLTLTVHLKSSNRLVLVDEDIQVSEGITVYGCHHAPKVVDFGSCGLNMIQDGRMTEDDFRHEQYLLVVENGKRILFSGCSHRGILNIMHWFRPDICIGGFHLSKLPLDETLAGYAKALDAYPTAYYTGHCTGTAQYQFMKERMRNLHYLSVGDSIVI